MKNPTRQVAVDVAAKLGGKVSRNLKNVGDDPSAEYKISIPNERFWLTVRPSIGCFLFDANHKRGCGERILFGAAFRNPYMQFRHSFEKIAASWALPVYGVEEAAEIAGEELMARLRPTYADWVLRARIRKFHFCDAQVRAIFDEESPDAISSDAATLIRFIRDVDSIARDLDPEKGTGLTRRYRQ